MAANKVRVTVCGFDYIIATNDSEEYVQGLAQQLDADMNTILTSTPSASVAASAVVSALGYLDEVQKTRAGMDNMRAQIKDYLEESAKAKAASEEARREVERLRKELTRLGTR